MKKLILFVLVYCLFIPLHAQQSLSPKKLIDGIISTIKKFQTDETKADSIARHPLGSNKDADFQRRYKFYDSVNNLLQGISKDSLAFDDEINLTLTQYNLEEEISTYQYKAYLNPILSDEGFHTSIAEMGSEILSTKKEYEDYIIKLKDVPRYMDENLELMRRGLALGISQPRSILYDYANTYEQHIVNDPEKSVFYRPFLRKPFGIDDSDWEKMKTEGKQAVRDSVIEGYKRVKIFFDKEYMPKTRTTVGVSNFPDGLAYYQDRVKHYTTTDISYEEIYQLGLQEVARIKNEMLEVIKEAKFKGTLKQFIAYLRSDPKFYATSAEQLLKEASFIAKKSDGALPSMFGKLPRQPYGVQAVPAYLAPTYTVGRYNGAPIKSKRPGWFWVNTYNFKACPLYNLEALALHESVPGHHLQIALTQELDSLPLFRRNMYVNAYGEGWGLYCEYLGTEMGFYKDPYTHFGRLTYEMWRACRLVLDVAIHTKGWTREQSVKYLSENTALSMHEVNTEINRYISWPGQALAYKTGEMKIKALRKLTEEKLKDKFDIRAFHDLILSQGTVTMPILQKMVERFIEKKLKEEAEKK